MKKKKNHLARAKKDIIIIFTELETRQKSNSNIILFLILSIKL